MTVSYLLFDLDGTLTDPAEGITNCVEYALEKFDIHPSSKEELYPYIGPPLTYSFTNYHGLSQSNAEQAVAYYRERFSEKGLFENQVYEGIAELLRELQNYGVTLIVATSKPEEFANRILEHFGLAQHFAFVAGCTLSGLRPEKTNVIAYVREQYPDINAENTLMIDIEGAHACGLPAVGVLYGYGDRAEMEAAKADFIVTTVEELREFLFRCI